MTPSAIFGSSLFGLFSSYPVTRRFDRRAITPIVFGATIIIFVLFALFNIFTQGTVPVSSSLLLQQYLYDDHANGNTTNCQPSLLHVADSLFTTASNATVTDNATLQSPGSFQWTVNSLTNEQGDLNSAEVPYDGEVLSCNMTSWGVTYYFTAGSFQYGSVKGQDPRTDSTFTGASTTIESVSLDLCSNFDLSTDNWPKFTSTVQDSLEAQIFLLSKIYQNLTFGPNTLPSVVFPYYNATAYNPLSSVGFIPRDVEQIASWFSGLVYFPAAADAPQRVCPPQTLCAQGTYYVGNQTFNDTALVFDATGSSSGLTIGVNGMGNLQPFKASDGNVTQLPGILPNAFNYSYGIASFAFDTAAKDVNNRALGVSHLCTSSGNEWEVPLSLIAVVLGNSFGMLGIATVLIFPARRFDQSLQRKDTDPARLRSKSLSSRQ